MRNIKILEQLTEDTFVVKIQKADRLKQVGVAHDFVEFSGNALLSTENGSVTFDGTTSNSIFVNSSVQIPIRMFKKFVLKFLNNHQHLENKHLDDREYYEDDKVNNPPKYKKGDKYPAYAYHKHTAISFYCKDSKEHKVAVLDEGDREPNIVSLEFYNKYIKPQHVR